MSERSERRPRIADFISGRCKPVSYTHLGSLTTNQTEHDLKLAPRSEYPPDGSHQEQFQGFISVFVRIGSQKVMQGITDALCAVPLQVVQVIPDRMVAVFIGNNLDGALHLFLAGKPLSLILI